MQRGEKTTNCSIAATATTVGSTLVFRVLGSNSYRSSAIYAVVRGAFIYRARSIVLNGIEVLASEIGQRAMHTPIVVSLDLVP